MSSFVKLNMTKWQVSWISYEVVSLVLTVWQGQIQDFSENSLCFNKTLLDCERVLAANFMTFWCLSPKNSNDAATSQCLMTQTISAINFCEWPVQVLWLRLVDRPERVTFKLFRDTAMFGIILETNIKISWNPGTLFLALLKWKGRAKTTSTTACTLSAPCLWVCANR